MLAALLKGLPGIDAEELDGLLKDLPMPEPGAKGGISVKEVAEVCFICYIGGYITCYIGYIMYYTTKKLVYNMLCNDLLLYTSFSYNTILNTYTITHMHLI